MVRSLGMPEGLEHKIDKALKNRMPCPSQRTHNLRKGWGSANYCQFALSFKCEHEKGLAIFDSGDLAYINKQIVCDYRPKEIKYISVTGASSKEDVDNIMKIFKKYGVRMDKDIIPAIGFQVMRANLQGSEEYSMRNAHVKELKHLIKGDFFAMLHYNSSTEDGYYKEIEQLLAICDPNMDCTRIQVNNRGRLKSWHEIYHIKEYHPEIDICLQVPPNKLEIPREKVVDKLKKYSHVIDSIIIDDSRGKGEKLNVDDVIDFYKEVRYKIGEVGIVIAGGLDGDIVKEDVKKIVDAVGNDISVDAEGKLRDQVGEKRGEDVLNYYRVEEYVKAAVEVLCR